MALNAILGLASKAAGREISRDAFVSGAKVAAIEKIKAGVAGAPRAIFNAAGGNRVPILNHLFDLGSHSLKSGLSAPDTTNDHDELEARNERNEDRKDKQRRKREQDENENEERQRKAHEAGTRGIPTVAESTLTLIAKDIAEIKEAILSPKDEKKEEKSLLGKILGAVGALALAIPGIAAAVGASLSAALRKISGLLNFGKAVPAAAQSAKTASAAANAGKVPAAAAKAASTAGAVGKVAGVMSKIPGAKILGKVAAPLGVGAAGLDMAQNGVNIVNSADMLAAGAMFAGLPGVVGGTAYSTTRLLDEHVFDRSEGWRNTKARGAHYANKGLNMVGLGVDGLDVSDAANAKADADNARLRAWLAKKPSDGSPEAIAAWKAQNPMLPPGSKLSLAGGSGGGGGTGSLPTPPKPDMTATKLPTLEAATPKPNLAAVQPATDLNGKTAVDLLHMLVKAATNEDEGIYVKNGVKIVQSKEGKMDAGAKHHEAAVAASTGQATDQKSTLTGNETNNATQNIFNNVVGTPGATKAPDFNNVIGSPGATKAPDFSNVIGTPGATKAPDFSNVIGRVRTSSSELHVPVGHGKRTATELAVMRGMENDGIKHGATPPGLRIGAGLSAAAANKERVLAEYAQQAGITDPGELRAFLAQTRHESGGYRYKEELWGKNGGTKAQRGYEGRRDLGNTEAGDGYRFRGRGHIQLTGRANYAAFAKDSGIDVVNNPDLVANDPKVAAQAAAWFWKKNVRRRAGGDWSNTERITKIVNGGQNGLADRKNQYAALGDVSGGSSMAFAPAANPSLDLFAQTQNAIDRGVRYGFGSKNSSSGQIDCSGWVAEINKKMIEGINDESIDPAQTKKAKALFTGGAAANQGAAGIIKNIYEQTGSMLTGSDVKKNLREGMIIGEDNGKKDYDAGRFKGIDHITQVVRDPKTGQLMISESRGGRDGGVKLSSTDSYFARKERRGTQLFGVDGIGAVENALGRRISAPPPGAGEALHASARKAERAATKPAIVNAPTTVVQQGGGGKNRGRDRQRGAASAPMIARNPDGAVRQTIMGWIARMT